MIDGSITIGTKIDQSGFKRGASSIKSSANSLASSLKGLASAIGIAFAATTIINFGKASVKAASDLGNAMMGLQSIMEGQGRSFANAQKFINEYVSDGLVPATEAITAYKNLALRGYSTTQIEQVMTALKDSSAYGRQASLSMGEAVRSATEGLKNENSILVDNAGVTKNVAKMWEDYAKSIGTTTNSLTKQQKIQAEVLGIMEETKYQTGDAAKVASGFSGSILKMQFNLNNLKIAIGNAITPIVEVALPVINRMITGMTRLANSIAQVTTALFGKQASAIKDIADSNKDAAAGQNDFADATNEAAKAAKGALAPFDELNVLQSENSGGGGGVELPEIVATENIEIGNGTKVSPDIQKAVNRIKSIFDGIKVKIDEIKASFSPSFDAWETAFYSLQEPVTTAFASISDSIFTLWTETLAPYYTYLVNDFVPTIANSFSTNLAPIFTDVMRFALVESAKDFEFYCQQVDRFVKDIFSPALKLVKSIVVDSLASVKNEWDKSGQMIMDKLGKVRDSFKEIWNSIYTNTLKPVIDKIWATLRNLWERHLKPLWEEVLSFFSKLCEAVMTVWNEFLGPIVKWLVDTLGPTVTRIFNGVIDVIGDLIGTIVDVVKGIFKALGGLLDFITGVFSGDWEKAWNGIKNFFIGIWDAIWSVVKGVVNLIIGGLNTLWGGVYDVVKGIVDAIGGIAGAIGDIFGADWHFSMPEEPPLIPKLARGGITTGPTIAQIGERGREAVLPLEYNTGWMDMLAAKLSDRIGGSGEQILIPIYVDGVLTDEYYVDTKERIARRSNGRS
ncbi:MAG TPA: hypothetical protein DD733_10275 [Clostridiales bacterium]|nr:hypothetical protein [Clostridiales bacterium]